MLNVVALLITLKHAILTTSPKHKWHQGAIFIFFINSIFDVFDSENEASDALSWVQLNALHLSESIEYASMLKGQHNECS